MSAADRVPQRRNIVNYYIMRPRAGPAGSAVINKSVQFNRANIVAGAPYTHTGDITLLLLLYYYY